MKYIGLTFLNMLVLATSLLAQGSWELKKDQDGIKIFNRRIEGSKLKEFKGIMEVNASVNEVVHLLMDVNKQDQFIYKAKKGSVETLKKDGNDVYTYMVIETPWPASDRDVVTLYHVNPPQKDGTVIIDVKAVNGMKPLQNKIVRVEKMKGYWKITPVGSNKVQITHQAYSSPGGKVPDALANSASVNAPFDMLTDLRKLLQ